MSVGAAEMSSTKKGPLECDRFRSGRTPAYLKFIVTVPSYSTGLSERSRKSMLPNMKLHESPHLLHDLLHAAHLPVRLNRHTSMNRRKQPKRCSKYNHREPSASDCGHNLAIEYFV